jgi:hypothetical protein
MKRDAGGGDAIAQNKFRKDLEKASLEAIAKVFVEAYADGEECGVGIKVGTSVCECAPKNEGCFVDGQVLGCCDKGYSCIKYKKSKDSRAKCRRNAALKNKRNVALTPTCGNK